MNYLYTYVRWVWKTLIGRFNKVLFYLFIDLFIYDLSVGTRQLH